MGDIAIYKDYNLLFGKCNRFSANLTEHTWCHKHGGCTWLGDIAHQHCLLCRVFYRMCSMLLKCAMMFQESK